MPVPMSSVRAHIRTNPSRWCCFVSRSELVEPGAATCVFTGMVAPCFVFKSLERTSYSILPGDVFILYHTTFFFVLENNSAEREMRAVLIVRARLYLPAFPQTSFAKFELKYCMGLLQCVSETCLCAH